MNYCGGENKGGWEERLSKGPGYKPGDKIFYCGSL